MASRFKRDLARLTGGTLRNIELRNTMQIKIIAAAVLVGVIGFMSAYTVESGNVAVERTLGKVNHEEQLQGLNFKMPFLTTSIEFSAKEIAIDINDLTPKAADNLSLKDLDVSVFYRVPKDRVSELMVKYAAAAVRGADGIYMPAYGLLVREARAAIYEQVSEIDSLQLHKQRELLQSAVLEELQGRLEQSDAGDIIITRVVVRALNTDPSIEAAIREAVEAEKRLEAKQVQVEIAKKDAEIEIERAKGIAEANKIINSSLTAEYLQHEVNKALQRFADNDGSVVVIPANMQGFEMILDSGQLRRSNQ
ncbi:MAG: SPFH domain-containing protein [Gammaproteobacteria bacterium]|nr:SPFH domain-containing protein [Gammaproteobacteria bacterium]